MKNERIAEELVKIAKSLMAESYDDYNDKTVYITIRTGNEAFQGGKRYKELSRILKELADNLESGNRKLMDGNGNIVGEFQEK